MSPVTAWTEGAAFTSQRPPVSCAALVQENANRLKAYKAMLVVFPRRSKKPKAGDASSEELQAVTQHGGAILPFEQKSRELETVSLSDEQKVRPSHYATFR